MAVNFACIICCVSYKSTDEIYSTTCGHIFHYLCMQQWKSRSTSCPQCRAYNPDTHKIYLNFEDSNEGEQTIIELKDQLEQTVLTVSELQHQLAQSEQNFMDLQQQYCKYEDEIKKFERTIEYLTVQNDGQKQQILMKTGENNKLKENLCISSKSENIECAAEEKIKVLQTKLKQVTNELSKEIRNNTELTVDKMKLQCLLKNYESGAKKNTPKENEKVQKAGKQNNIPQKEQKKGAQYALNKTNNQNSSKKENDNNENRSVVIKGVRKSEMEMPLKEIVLKLAIQMDLHYTSADIENVYVLQKNFYVRNQIQPDTLTLVAKFKSLDMKVAFLNNKEKLNKGETKCIIIYEYVNDHANSLFYYAKTLRSHGYKFVYCKNGNVFVRKTLNSPITKVNNKQEVDELIKSTQENIETGNSDNKIPTCDEHYYLSYY